MGIKQKYMIFFKVSLLRNEKKNDNNLKKKENRKAIKTTLLF